MKPKMLKSHVWMMALLASAPLYGCAGERAKSEGDATATPRRANGKPDLNGVWTNHLYEGAGKEASVDEDGNPYTHFASRTGGLYAIEIDGKVVNKGRRNKPMYRPEYWEKVRYLEAHALQEDLGFLCAPWGVPRVGSPQQIVQQDDLIVFLYAGLAGSPNPVRPILLNREHNPARVAMQVSMGDSVGRWDGDTLVVDTIGLSDETWITALLGYFHTTSMHVVERFTREGNKLKYEVTVEDPEVLLEPWVWEPRTVELNPKPDIVIPEDFPCIEKDAPFTPVS